MIGKRIDYGIGSNEKAPATPVKKNDNSPVFVSVKPHFELEDLVVPDRIRDQLLDLASYYENSNKVFGVWGLEKTHKFSKKYGINLWGPPGTGKTMAAHAIASSLKRNILIVNYADIESKYVGETPKNICKAFDVAKETNSILFFDEADAILSRRVTNMSNATDVSVNQTRSVMLMLLNEYQDVIIFASNFISNYDPAFMRRILVHVQFEMPDERCRYFLWKKYIPEQMPNDFDLKYIAEHYENLSGGDISNAVLSAAFASARENQKVVSQELLERSIQNILESKKANSEKTYVQRREVSEEYVKSQLKLN